MDVSMRDYVDNCINGLKNLMEQHFKLDELARITAADALRTKLESMNEFRAQVLEERGKFATKESTALIYEAFDQRLKKLEQANAFSSGKLWMVMAGFAAIPTIVSIIAIIITITGR